MNLFSRAHRRPAGAKPVIVVSGLPRTGTSMMMRMLAEGGLPVLSDHLRGPDQDNPNGYFELEVVRQLKEGNSAWLDQAEGKVVKVISALLEYLPADRRYKIIFMERDARETLASQKKMLNHRGQMSRLSDEEMERQFFQHLSAMKPWLMRQPNMDVLFINYNNLLAEPGRFCDRICEFLDFPLNQAQMLSVPDHHLYRNRTQPGT